MIIENNNERYVLYADDGMILTNNEIYGKEIWLSVGEQPSGFTEITEIEYEKIMENELKETENSEV